MGIFKSKKEILVITNIDFLNIIWWLNNFKPRISGSAFYIRYILMKSFLKKEFINKDGIFSFEIKDEKTKKVTDFYNEKPFPNYKNDDNKQTILNKGNKNFLANQ